MEKITVNKFISEDYMFEHYSIKGLETKLEFNCSLDSPEDNNMGRAFSDIYFIPALIMEAHQLGKRGIDIGFEFTEEDID